MKLDSRYFPINSWQEAFQYYDLKKDYYDDVIMVVSKQEYLQGYWIESRRDLSDYNRNQLFVYQGDEVNLLKQRVVDKLINGLPRRIIL